MSKAIDSRFPPPRGHHRRPGPVGRWSAGGGSDRLSPSDPLSLPDISSTPITRSRSARMRMESAIDESSRDSTSFRVPNVCDRRTALGSGLSKTSLVDDAPAMTWCNPGRNALQKVDVRCLANSCWRDW
jgi:hypothetical protein